MRINLILLAAGNSKRFNGNKLLAIYKDKPIYMYIVEKVLDLKLNKIICVTQYKEIKEALLNTDINVVMNENSSLGVSSSIKLGINFDKNADGYMFMVCDQPFISIKTLNSLIDNFINGNKGIVCVGYGDNKGNPVIFSKRYINELLSLEGDNGGKRILKGHLNDLNIVNVDNEIELADIDTQEEFIKLTLF
ncbi:MAG: nucleotidyltransferase family protein [Clostridium celatum]|uniref:nucleotidyltransferase family protein n=1 Tax=Clostridium sp. TaxID=1506 RepID=UPI0025B9B905|nr:nucleotidyltransferase family protein [Clostridium sp.]MBS4958366.1 nucleotidyltransferase family protein [Clostridium sp.]MDU4882655.1 nucleotidyltransferase family protein [Clostridium celatum]MDU5260923.1 nucleotidyltransferase family protein [Clostridium celatum]MDU7078203.1 nucleotidyltransferase family protein [Clostridium celatum]